MLFNYLLCDGAMLWTYEFNKLLEVSSVDAAKFKLSERVDAMGSESCVEESSFSNDKRAF